jgi:hypothetical protein
MAIPRSSLTFPLQRLEEVTLSIRPVRLNKSIYLRVPNDIADLIEIDHQAGVTLTFEEQVDRFLLVYSVQKETLAPHLATSQFSHEGYGRVEFGSRSKHRRVDP